MECFVEMGDGLTIKSGTVTAASNVDTAYVDLGAQPKFAIVQFGQFTISIFQKNVVAVSSNANFLAMITATGLQARNANALGSTFQYLAVM